MQNSEFEIEYVNPICESCLRLLEDEHDSYSTCGVCGQTVCLACTPPCNCIDNPLGLGDLGLGNTLDGV
jgi:hypothetical protein